MPHLTLEALARLVDETPTPDERTHLAECQVCRQELDGLLEQTESLAALPKMTPPPDLWPALRRELREEGLVAKTGRVRAVAPWIRAAAAVVLFLTGGATGFAVRGAAGGPGEVAGAMPQADGPATLALDPGPGGDLSQDVERAQEVFAAALDRYMMANSTEAPDPAARLAALDNIVLTTAEALNESPADPVINSYHLTAVAQRNELLRQIAASGEPVF
jgi:hypothetical protein